MCFKWKLEKKNHTFFKKATLLIKKRGGWTQYILLIRWLSHCWKVFCIMVFIYVLTLCLHVVSSKQSRTVSSPDSFHVLSHQILLYTQLTNGICHDCCEICMWVSHIFVRSHISQECLKNCFYEFTQEEKKEKEENGDWNFPLENH